MSDKALAFCGWCGIITILMMVIGLGPMAQMTPPPSPEIGATEAAALFRGNASGILAGAFLVNIGVAASIALVVGMSAVIGRMATPSARVLSSLQLATGTTASLFLMLPVMILSVGAFRPERSPELILMLHDFATFATFLPFSVATLEAWAIAAAIFSDRSVQPAFPRWLAYLNILAGLSYVPMGLAGMFKSGIFASNGLLGWWAPTAIVAAWYVTMGLYVVKAAKNRAAQEGR